MDNILLGKDTCVTIKQNVQSESTSRPTFSLEKKTKSYRPRPTKMRLNVQFYNDYIMIT